MKTMSRMFSMLSFISMLLVLFFLVGGCSDDDDSRETANFTVQIQNISDTSNLPTPLAPGVWAIHSDAYVLFQAGQSDYGMGLEALAEDGDPSMLASNLATNSNVVSSDVFNTPSGSNSPGPLLPGSGSAYEFTFSASLGDRLSFATMLVQSNDLYFGPSGTGLPVFESATKGISLFEGGKAISGDITDQILLWDAGTEVNEEPGEGPNQAPRQSGPDTGIPENGVVQVVDDEYSYPQVKELIQVTITSF
jgi:hypothetical protein